MATKDESPIIELLETLNDYFGEVMNAAEDAYQFTRELTDKMNRLLHPERYPNDDTGGD